MEEARTILQKLRCSLVSLSDKNWITPDHNAVSEYEYLSNCAMELGLSVAIKKESDLRMNDSISEALCGLYDNDVDTLERIFTRFADVDFYEPLQLKSDIVFYLEMVELLNKATQNGVPHCIPEVANKPEYCAEDLYDISLIIKNTKEIVPNNAYFNAGEPFFFLIGANSGGKTTYLRAVGINLLLFLSGCPIFARYARIYPFAYMSAHFPKDERFYNTGRLDDEACRVAEMLTEAASATSFLLFNETFSGTNDEKGFRLLTETAEKIQEYGVFGLYVTHFHEVTALNYPILSAGSDYNGGEKPTYRIVRFKGKANSYAQDILKKYHIDEVSLRERRKHHGNKSDK